jgi:hypothetical protein
VTGWLNCPDDSLAGCHLHWRPALCGRDSGRGSQADRGRLFTGSGRSEECKLDRDLDEINRSFDTQDWQSIVPGQQPRGWPELRKYGFAGLTAPFQSAEILIDTFELEGDTAVLTGKLRNVSLNGKVSFIPLKETWKRTVMGWKRQVHQKFLPGESPK